MHQRAEQMEKLAHRRALALRQARFVGDRLAEFGLARCDEAVDFPAGVVPSDMRLVLA